MAIALIAHSDALTPLAAWLAALRQAGYLTVTDTLDPRNHPDAYGIWVGELSLAASVLLVPLPDLTYDDGLQRVINSFRQQGKRVVLLLPDAHASDYALDVYYLSDYSNALTAPMSSPALMSQLISNEDDDRSWQTIALQRLPERHARLPLAEADDAWRVWVAGKVVAQLSEQHAPGLQPDATEDADLQQVADWLAVILSDATDLPAYERVECAITLGLLGDPRPGVGVRAGVPDIDWVQIPAGAFTFGIPMDAHTMQHLHADHPELPQETLTLPTFYLSRYPVTVAQYAVFVRETARGKPASLEHLRKYGTYPVGNITWHDAIAFCEWLSKKLDAVIRLPTEAEWEKAARGTDARLYPYGNAFDPDRANTRESGIGSATPVGAFPSGASPYGVLDLGGNVWEWCRNKWISRQLKLGQARLPLYTEAEDTSATGIGLRVICGGCYTTSERLSRTSAHYLRAADYRVEVQGFRLARE
ncbi:MAG: SUMF1/EgtB/PvdO family nonheme iron enzyme [Armatimonadetes bacterium]|nr:SUMF1/EgtB/PvdO family nonheme iron enzyme [Anaerolineae bacterium]